VVCSTGRTHTCSTDGEGQSQFLAAMTMTIWTSPSGLSLHPKHQTMTTAMVL
jgi:hypothetical protein